MGRLVSAWQKAHLQAVVESLVSIVATQEFVRLHHDAELATRTPQTYG